MLVGERKGKTKCYQKDSSIVFTQSDHTCVFFSLLMLHIFQITWIVLLWLSLLLMRLEENSLLLINVNNLFCNTIKINLFFTYIIVIVMAVILLVCFVTVLFFKLSHHSSTLSCLLYSIVCFLPTILFLHRNYMCLPLFSVAQQTTSTTYYRLLFNTCLYVFEFNGF